LSGCGSGGAPSGPASGSVSGSAAASGTITGFGSVFVNVKRFDANRSSFIIDGKAAIHQHDHDSVVRARLVSNDQPKRESLSIEEATSSNMWEMGVLVDVFERSRGSNRHVRIGADRNRHGLARGRIAR
ncbi:MAG: hypothetical protein ACREJN_03160, partial [Nitrospiraceae bacterium]